MIMDALGQELEQGKLETACHCFTLFKASFGTWLLAGGLSFSLCSPFHVLLSVGQFGLPHSMVAGFPGQVPRRASQAEALSPSLRSPTVPLSLCPPHEGSHKVSSGSRAGTIDSVSWWRCGKVLQQQGLLQQATKCCVTVLERCSLSH